MLESGELDIIFTVDLFNEGIDIPSEDTLLFARPTESLVVFTQQIGRGLRKFVEKNTCVIIDFIGNYRNADIKLTLFDTQKSKNSLGKDFTPIVPAECEIHLETEVINLLEALKKKRSPRKERIFHDYLKVKNNLGRSPTYKEIHLNGSINSKEYKQAFGGYFSFLYEFQELSEQESIVYEQHYRWLNKVEKETMTKSYKKVILQFLLNKGTEEWLKPTPEEVAPYFHQFYMAKNYRKRIDFSSKNTKELWEYDQAKVVKLIAKMPMSKWVDRDELVYFENGKFGMNFSVLEIDQHILHAMTLQICNYKMQWYFERKSGGQLNS
ncbi:hypothetical protein [Virgibacillus oceani]|uniref:Helicase C-terminal domain-containing protein n=1 Tax=Virgibacillus oceani TaxID=1479511 RepID=A0A917HH38_9BACI|nr:hypothetical protein [Virgibacillus oceani]GGG78401.1 hypothetical protein GCM10011398_24570 [Virgibacillus oceani]